MSQDRTEKADARLLVSEVAKATPQPQSGRHTARKSVVRKDPARLRDMGDWVIDEAE
jgi:hypothetical protein